MDEETDKKRQPSLTDDQAQEARMIIQKIVQHQLDQPAEEKSLARLSRLYHELGNLNVQLGGLQQAVRFYLKALEGRRAVRPLPADDIFDTTKQLARALQMNQHADKARLYLEWLRRDIEPLRRRTGSVAVPDEPIQYSGRPSTTARLPEAHAWAKGQGFEVDAPSGFQFEEWDRQKDNSPLHLAVQEENAEMVKIMADHVVNLDTGLELGKPTPLLLAASTKDRETVSVLLERNARLDVRDRSGRTALHRCQGRSGGTQVAEMILNKAPHMINDVDNAGKTALYMAVEMTNEKMVQFLLRRDADPNKCFLPQGNWATSVLCTPLIAAIDIVATKTALNIHMVEDLLAHGADPSQTAGDGRDAFSAANNSGLASYELKKLLQKYDRPMSRTGSAVDHGGGGGGGGASIKRTFSKTASFTPAATGTRLSRSKFFDRQRFHSTA